MAGTMALGTMAAGATAAVDVPGNSSSNKTPMEAMANLMADMAKLLETPMTAENHQERKAALTKLRTEMVDVQKAIDTENRHLTEVQAHIQGETKRLRT